MVPVLHYSLRFCRSFVAIFLLSSASGSLIAQETLAASHVIVPGYERFREQQLTNVDAGKLLIAELNCQSCHGTILKDIVPQRHAPILTNVSGRVQFEYLRDFIANPQKVKPGTAMPQIHGDDDHKTSATAIAHFLASGGVLVPTPVSTAAITNGEQLFHSLGCAACHGDQRIAAEKRPTYVMPLGPLDTKYTVGSLMNFLNNPHAVRPSGRMPALNLNDEEARNVANYLLKNVDVEPNLTVEFYEGNWENLPNFDELTPVSTGPAAAFDVSAATKKDQFALRFKAWLHVPKDGEYQFWLGSDDGSRLLIGGNEIVGVDGIHPHSTKDAKAMLTTGAHPVVVEYFEGGGQESLQVEIAGPGIGRQPLEGLVSNSSNPPEERQAFQIDAELAAEGKRLFVSLGCRSCHQHEGLGQTVRLPQQIPEFNTLDLAKGCMKREASPGVPSFALTEQQRTDIAAAIVDLTQEAKAEPVPVESAIKQVMLTLNCFACHQRGMFGGIPREHDHLFAGSIPEMGDEGRVPPHLDGIGDKLQESWLKEVLNNGAKDRPYMATRMPKFGEHNVGQLIKLFAEHDAKQEVPEVVFEDPMHRVNADARLMVGDQALSCIKCHYFDKYKATGIQSLDMTTMTKRLRRDWFHRYLINPQKYRPGTRMPTAWPRGKTVVRKILHGDTPQQIEAIWQYLSEGKDAKLPSGLVAEAIELKPTDHPIVYRNFLEGLSARGIAVGFPERVHYAWDAEQMNLRLIWHGAFIDAGLHWVGRGPGNQMPLGDHVMQLVSGQPLAVLESADQNWPSESARDGGFRFLGYQLNIARQPAFRYEWKGIRVTDFLEPVENEPDTALQRTLTFSSDTLTEDMFLRIASADRIEQTNDGWLLNDAILLKLETSKPIVRDSQGKRELIVPLHITGDAVVRYQMIW